MEKLFYAVLAAVAIFVSFGAQYAWCADQPVPVKATLKITVKTSSRCAGGNCSVKQYSVPVQINTAPACKNGKCNIQQRKGNSNGK
jgi:hypothetical protein